MRLNRRRFLNDTTLAAAGLGLGGWLPPAARAQGWADLPTGFSWPTPVKVLEIFCYSGLSQWETFWVTPGTGGGANFQTFDTDVANLAWYCSSPPSPASETKMFAADAGGTNISWGPATKPLWRTDILSRTRMVAIAHPEFAHALAIPLALTGHKLGNPRAAGMGAAVQHRQMSLASSTVPYAYVIASSALPWEFTIGAAAANGFHPGYAQPLIIRTGDSTLLTQLRRDNATGPSDDLLRTYQAMEMDRLRYQGHDPVRSTGFSSYSSSLSGVLHGVDLYTKLQSNPNLFAVPSNMPCTSMPGAGQLGAMQNDVSTELGLATFLLTSVGARYACVVDHGIDLAQGVPYDLHENDATKPFERILSNNLFNLCSLLANQIDPNGTDPTKLNLNDTMIIIHSEFGRTLDRQLDQFNNPLGRNHWPSGYAAILIGGPLLSGSTIVGGINSSGRAFGPAGPTADPLSPTDIRGALLIAAGVDPLAQENFNVSDFTTGITNPVNGLGTEDAIRQNLKTKILGL